MASRPTRSIPGVTGSSGNEARREVSLLIDGDRSSNTSREDAADGADEASSCFEEAMKRCDALRRSETYLDFFTRAAPRAPASHSPSRRTHPGSSFRAPRHGVNMALRLAEPGSRRIIGCGACGCWLLRDQDVLHEEERAARLTLDDSDSTVCARRPNTKAVDGEFVINAVKKQRAHEDWAYAVRNASCSQCGLFLGVEVIRTCEPSTDFAPVPAVIQSRAELLLWLLFETSRKHASISAPLSGWLRTQHATQATSRRRDASVGSPAAQAQQRSEANDEHRRIFQAIGQRAFGGPLGAHLGTRSGAASAAVGTSGGSSSSAAPPRRSAPQEMVHDPESGARIGGPGHQGSLLERLFSRCRRATRRICSRRNCLRRHVVQTTSVHTTSGGALGGTPMGRRSLDDDGTVSDVDIGVPQQVATSSAQQRMNDLMAVASGRGVFGDNDIEGSLNVRRRGGSRRNESSSGSQVSRASHDSAIGSSENTAGHPRTTDGVCIGQFFLGTRYLRLLDASPNGLGRRAAMYPVARILCAGALCQNTLSYADMILDCNRRWSLGDGDPERAMFMNTLCDGSYTARNCREHRLAQGLFDMADIHCKSCGWQVGYAFVRDKSEEKRNVNQVGRFGLVCSRVRLDAGTEVYVPSGRYRHPDNFAGIKPTAPGSTTSRLATARTPRQPSPVVTTVHTL